MSTTKPGAVRWLRGFGGCSKGWPVRVCDAREGSAQVKAAKKPDRILVYSFGDKCFVWSKAKALSPLTVTEARAALNKATNDRVKPALNEVIAFLRPEEAIQAPPPSPATTQKKRKRSMDTEPEAVPEAAKETLPEVATTNPDGLCAYELKRLENMAANQKVLEALGIADASSGLRESATAAAAAKRAPRTPEELAARAAARHAALLAAQANRRTSSRLVSGGAGTPPARYAEEYAALDEAEYVRVPKRLRKAAGGRQGRGRGSRADSEQSALSEEERTALAEAHAEAKGWLAHMQRYFSNKLSEANLRNVMKQATALATGAGVPHTFKPTYFRKGQPVTLDEDLVALRAEANVFLRPDEDPGHGWRLDHPIGKMCIFQVGRRCSRPTHATPPRCPLSCAPAPSRPQLVGPLHATTYATHTALCIPLLRARVCRHRRSSQRRRGRRRSER
jgi:hypothetical protein